MCVADRPNPDSRLFFVFFFYFYYLVALSVAHLLGCHICKNVSKDLPGGGEAVRSWPCWRGRSCPASLPTTIWQLRLACDKRLVDCTFLVGGLREVCVCAPLPPCVPLFPLLGPRPCPVPSYIYSIVKLDLVSGFPSLSTQFHIPLHLKLPTAARVLVSTIGRLFRAATHTYNPPIGRAWPF